MLDALKRLRIRSSHVPDSDSESPVSGTPSAKQNPLNFLPKGVEWKSRTLEHLSQEFISRSILVDCVLRSLDEGLLIATTDGRITFANHNAAKILGVPEPKLVGLDLFKCINDVETQRDASSMFAGKTLATLFSDQGSVEREITIGDSAQSNYILRLSAVAVSDPSAGETIGIVATFTDITKHRELQRTQNDVVTLVTHELRTPLTAIQGMSEVLTGIALRDVPRDQAGIAAENADDHQHRVKASCEDDK